MRYTLYYIGGPMDLTKQAREGDGPNGSLLEIKVAKPLRMRDYTVGDKIEFEKPIVHRYRILPVPPTGSYWDHYEKLFVAVYTGEE